MEKICLLSKLIDRDTILHVTIISIEQRSSCLEQYGLMTFSVLP